MGRRKELYWLKCSDLRERYVDKRMTMKVIGAEYGIGADLVSRRLKECGLYEIEDYSWIDCSDLRNMYTDGQMSISAIADALDVPMSVISRLMDRCGVEVRIPSELGELIEKQFYIDPVFLKWLYADRQMSTTQIGRLVGVGQSTIMRRLQEHGIKTRPVGGSSGRRTYKQLRSIDGDLMVYIPEHERSSGQGWIKLRMLAYEAYHGELPPKGDRIHIIDGNVDNLSRSNLRAMTNSEHSKFHCYANLKATGNAFKPCPKDQLATYMKEWDMLQEENDEFDV